MAIYHLRAQVISRGGGRSAVAAAAYRHRTEMKLDTEETIRTLRYTGITEDLVFAEMALPPDAPKWIERLVEGMPAAKASEALWNAVEQVETRVNGQLAREIVLALPLELTREQNVELVRDYVAEAFTTRGMIADWVYHEKANNPHIHVMLTMNPLTADGFGKRLAPRKDADGNIVRVNGQIQYDNWAGDKGLLKLWRKQWADNVNRHLARAGLDVRIDERSHKELGIEITPTTHLGPGGHAIALRQGASELKAQADQARRDAARKLLDQPDGALKLITNERSVFTEADMMKLVERYANSETETEELLDAAFDSETLIQLVPDSVDPDTGVVLTEARYTTQEMLDIERAMMDTARRLRLVEGFGVSEKSVDRALAEVAEARGFALSEEQAEAVRYLGRDRAIAVVVGFAGAGKSTMLEAARRAWEAEGRRVIGGALAGKAAAELQKSSGIAGRTLASWEFAWNNDREVLGKGDVLVVDEAGMVSSKQLARIIARVEDAGAKIVLVGDAEQLQPIEAGAAFRAISERVGLMELDGIRRQTEEWAQEASRDLARGRVGKALDAYNERGHVTWSDTREDAHEALVADWLADGGVEEGSSLALAHSNADVFMINGLIREARKDRGELTDGIEYQTSRGVREFAAGDRLLLLKNDRDVKNGMLGTVESVSPEALAVKLDVGRTIEVKPEEYDTFDHGYAATVHKSQGATVERAYVLATWGMDRHLAYVAMSRHRDAVTLYANRKDFADYSVLTERLAESGAKGTTLDYEERAEYLERRGHESERTLDPVKAGLFERQIEWIDQQRHRLARLWSRIESAITGIQQAPIVVRSSTATPAPAAKLMRRLRAGMGAEAGAAPAAGAGGTAAQPAAKLPPWTGPLFSITTTFEGTVAEVAETNAVAAPDYLEASARLQRAAGVLWSDPKAACARIEIEWRLGIDPDRLRAEITDAPDRFGTVRGAMTPNGQPDGERRAALEDLGFVAEAAGRAATEWRDALEDARADEIARRQSASVAVPRLSTRAEGFLLSMEEQRKDELHPHRYSNSLFRLERLPRLSAEVMTFADALNRRFWEGAFLEGADRATRRAARAAVTGEAEQKRMSAMRPVFEAAQQISREAARLGIRYKIQDQLETVGPRAAPGFDSGALSIRGIADWNQSLIRTVEEKVTFTPTLKAQWQDVTDRLDRMYKEPDAAAARMHLDAVAAAPDRHREVLDQLAQQPEIFGELRGKTGLFASAADRETRRLAIEGGTVLRTEIERYHQLYTSAAARFTQEEKEARERARLDIPALSPNAIVVLEKVRDAIDRNDLPAAMGYALADRMVKAELDRYNAAIESKFGDRAFLGLDAKAAAGPVLDAIAGQVATADRNALASQWANLRAAQQLAAQERTETALKQSEAQRQSQAQGIKP